MHRFFVAPDRCSGPVFALGETEARHAHQVLRLGPGDRLEVLDGRGGLIEAEITAAGRSGVEVRTLARHPGPRRGRHRIVLLQALLKGKALEVVLEKSVELGVDRVILLETERCVARVPADETARKRSLWTQTLIEAAKQSRNPWLPELIGPVSIPAALDLVEAPGGMPVLVASLEPGTPPMGSVLESLSVQAPLPGADASTSWSVAVGPEGDFSPAELGRLRDRSTREVSLGPLILRAETASIAAVAILADFLRRTDSGPPPEPTTTRKILHSA